MAEKCNADYPHVHSYRDVKPEIDAGMKKVKFLLGYQETYFAAQRDLKTALRRMTNEALIERMKAEKNTAFIDEIKKSTPHKATIEKLIGDIDVFEAENKKLLSAIIKNGKLDSKEFAVIYPYLYTLAEDNTSHDRISPELILFFGENTKKKCYLSSVDEYAIFYYLLIKIKAKGRYAFAYPHLADELVECIESSENMPSKSRMNFYLEAADYYITACQRDKAMTCYQKAALTAKENGDVEGSAYAMQKYYRVNQSFPEPMQIKPNAEEIQAEYGKYAPIVLQGINAPTFKVDPIEFTENFAEKYQAVMWRVEAEIDKTRDLNSVYQRWSLMEKYFAEISTPWRCPKAMNPGMMFD
ncbi:MAG: hypothetical protein II297_03785 [Clostridia bacterium]|nr:hypothetical protein [Clostridia bacterium]